MRNFGIPSGRLTTGANHQPPATHDDHSPRDPLIPAGSVLFTGSTPFERTEFAQTALDVVAVVFGALFLCTFVVGVSIAVYLLTIF